MDTSLALNPILSFVYHPLQPPPPPSPQSFLPPHLLQVVHGYPPPVFLHRHPNLLCIYMLCVFTPILPSLKYINPIFALILPFPFLSFPLWLLSACFFLLFPPFLAVILAPLLIAVYGTACFQALLQVAKNLFQHLGEFGSSQDSKHHLRPESIKSIWGESTCIQYLRIVLVSSTWGESTSIQYLRRLVLAYLSTIIQYLRREYQYLVYEKRVPVFSIWGEYRY